MGETQVAHVRSAGELISLLADQGSFTKWDEELASTDPLVFTDSRPYTERLAEAKSSTGRNEAVVTGRATLGGHSLAVIAGEFGFMGGSMGVATGERITRAFERALSESLPVVGLTCSGGARMQEGSLGFVQMVKTAAAAQRLRAAGLAYVVYMLHPTTGGVFASWASLGQLTLAEPRALLGFYGPRAAQMVSGGQLPEGVQSAENLRAHGLIDDIFEPQDMREHIGKFLVVASGERGTSSVPEPDEPLPEPEPGDAWESIGHTRSPLRPGALSLLEACGSDFTLLGGDGQGGDDAACVAVLGRICGLPCVVVAQERSASMMRARMTPAGYRKARRAIALAGELRIPLVTIVDTPTAELSAPAEQQGLSGELARCLADLSAAPSPTLCVLLGEGGGGGALALLPCDRVVAARHAWLAPVSPEGASAIIHRTTERASELASSQRLSSWDLHRFGIVDVVVPEDPGADSHPDIFLRRLGGVIGTELRALLELDGTARLKARRARYRAIGTLGTR